MRAVYLAHPYWAVTQDGIEQNVNKVRCAAKIVARHGYLPFAPHLAISYCSDALGDRSMALHHGLMWLERCDELWVIGSISRGVLDEITFARGLGLPIRWLARGDEDDFGVRLVKLCEEAMDHE